jgi:hypothetical protein
MVIGPRPATMLATGIALLGIASRFTPEESEWGWVVRTAGASLLVGVVPGAVALLAWRPRKSFALLEWLGLAIAISCVSVQVLTVAAISLHQSPVRAIAALGLVVAVHLWFAARRGDDGVSLHVSGSDIVLMLMLAAVGFGLYAEGSPFVAQQEERVHISIVQRLSQLTTPSIRNIYLSPDVVYTYPFPGTHYLMALMSRVGDIEPAFLYHKLRAFWGLAAIVILWGCARAIFEHTRVAFASALVATLFVANGTFAAWSQMAPFSHAADVAMGVLLPALLLVTFTYCRAAEPREQRVFLAVTVGLAVMLIMVHPREIVQYVVYLAGFAIMLIAARGPRPLLTRTVLLLLVVTCIFVGYQLWHRIAVPEIESIVSERRQDLLRLFTGSSWTTLFGQPVPLLEGYMPAFGLLFRWWIPIVLLGSPVVLYFFRHRPLAWMVVFGIVAYVGVIRFPVLAIPYIYATYFEILYAPVRNVAFFVHLLAGVSLYLLAARLARYRVVSYIAAPALAWVAVELFRRVGPATMEQPDVLFLSVLVGYAVGLVDLLSRHRVRTTSYEWLDQPPRRSWLVFALIIIPVVAGTWISDTAVARLPWRNEQPTPAALVAGIGCGDEMDRCAPPLALIRFVRQEISPEAIFAVDYHQVNEPTVFLPQQVDVWSGAIEGLVAPEQVFPVYFRHLDRARSASLDQPFFNDRETREERLAFLSDTGATYVLVTPRVYPMMTAVLARDPDIFASRYDDGQWALYEVRR